jgi:hypothetical protein
MNGFATYVLDLDSMPHKNLVELIIPFISQNEPDMM